MKEGHRIRNAAEKRMIDLENLIEKKKEQLKNVPEGRLRATCIEGIDRYYHCMPGEARNGVYLHKDRQGLAMALAQKAYDEQVLAAAEKECRALHRYLGNLPKVIVEDVYEKYSSSRKKVVVPVIETDEAFLERWLHQPRPNVQSRREHPVVVTDQGKELDSKAELVLSMQFQKKGVHFLQQFPIVLKGRGTIYVDFKVLNLRTRKEYVWEHLGMLDSAEYRRHSLPRLNDLILNGYIPGVNLILTWESEESKLDMRAVDKLINAYLM